MGNGISPSTISPSGPALEKEKDPLSQTRSAEIQTSSVATVQNSFKGFTALPPKNSSITDYYLPSTSKSNIPQTHNSTINLPKLAPTPTPNEQHPPASN